MDCDDEVSLIVSQERVESWNFPEYWFSSSLSTTSIESYEVYAKPQLNQTRNTNLMEIFEFKKTSHPD
jgi:hypothetical protein